jgi:hypothetical protein
MPTGVVTSTWTPAVRFALLYLLDRLVEAKGSGAIPYDLVLHLHCLGCVLYPAPHQVLQSAGALSLGAITPFCSCSGIPVLAGLLRSGAPFGPLAIPLDISGCRHEAGVGLRRP